MKAFFASILGLVIVLVFVLVLSTGGNIINTFNYYVFGTLNEQVRTEIFHKSQAYNDGMVRDLYNSQRQYAQATDLEAKKAILAYTRHQISVYPQSKVPDDLQNFYNLVMGN